MQIISLDGHQVMLEPKTVNTVSRKPNNKKTNNKRANKNKCNKNNWCNQTNQDLPQLKLIKNSKTDHKDLEETFGETDSLGSVPYQS